MATALDLLADDLGVSGRTLRRAVDDGAIRATRVGPRRLTLTPGEESYVLRAWPLIGSLRALLRTERNVRFALLFGSRARGDERPDSDVDLLVTLADPAVGGRLRLERRIERAVGLPVEIVTLEEAGRSPAFLAAAVEEGRVLLDRDGTRRSLQHGHPALARRAAAEDRELREAAAAALAELTGR